VRRISAALLGLTAAACGARSELSVPTGTASTTGPCGPLSIGILGNPGTYNSSDDFLQWLATSGASPQRIQTTPDEQVTTATFQPFDVVVLDWLTRDYEPAEAATFADWVASGGGVVSMSGYDNNTTDDWHANSLLAPLEVAYAGPLIDGPVTDLAAHPITAGLDSVVFEGGYAVFDLGGDASTRTPLAFLQEADGTVSVGYAVQMGTGRAFVWGDEWIQFTPSVSQGSMFPAELWVQAFGWISPAGKCALTPPG
jgi:hypothetical protein